ncbi:hypothetical protein ACS0TY_000152 [Phlomoides rotata]
MSNNNPSSSSTLRFLGLIKQPESESPTRIRIGDPLELHESDVVWSFAAFPDSYLDRTHAPPSPRHRRTFNPVKSGLSAALSDDDRHLIRRKSTLNRNITTRRDDMTARFPQSAPVKIPVWPKGEITNGKLTGFDEAEDDEGGWEEEEMVPPHVIVARSHVTFSVFEGAGRTLKGRDLRRIRNAVLQKTGFID